MGQNIDVLVIGAGPTGLMMAAEAARHGLSCRIIDRGSINKDKSRAVAIQARTLEIFDHIGIVSKFLEEGIQIRAGNPISGFKRLARLNFDHLQSPFPFVLSLEQAKTEELLGNYAATLGIKIERQIEFIRLDQQSDCVEVLLQDIASGKEELVKASWVIGCDGAHSKVRKQLSLAFEGKAFGDVFSLADVHVDWEYPHSELFVFLNAKGVLAALPLPEQKRYRLVFQLLRCRNLLKTNKKLPHGQIVDSIVKEPTLEEVEKLLHDYAGPNVHVSDPVWMANFHIHSRISASFQKGRVFLAGDAAHIHSPVGGQGMNTGLQDAFNLAWKLALVQKKQAPLNLLETYDLERRTVGKRVLKATEQASFFATLQNPFAIWLRNALITLFFHTSLPNKILPRIISQTGICYPKSFIVVERVRFRKGPKVGLRAPNAPLLHNGKSSDLFSLLRDSTTFHLLMFSGPEKFDMSKIAARYASKFIVPILITYGNDPLPGIESYCDPIGKAHHIYGADAPLIYLIRPDTYIGYRSAKDDEDALNAYLHRCLSINR